MMPLVSVLGCGTWLFLIEEQLYCLYPGADAYLDQPDGRRAQLDLLRQRVLYAA